ncbi:PAN domain protein [Trichuris suis]|uniref:Apple domain-containing protein n=1 Tax=Trichuris suis TaxID=68888 RepID=A0A085MK20_9BILA|nr:hypothetical protein M513_01669 [Trichuris suis]KHJ49225.1 PAN domain protein [Trichuris suis]
MLFLEGRKFNRIIPDPISATRFGKMWLTLLVLLLVSIEKQTNGQELLLQIPATSEECALRNFPFSENWPVLYLGEEDAMPSLESCVAQCRTSSMADLCSAVAYAEDKQKCMLLQFGFYDEDMATASAGYQSFYVVEDCFRAEAHGHNAEAAVMQLDVLKLTCEVEITVGESSARGVKSIETRENVPSLEQCLTMCKFFEEASHCMGVHYSYSQHTCKLMVADPQLRSGYKIGADESLAVLKTCVETPTREPRNYTMLIELPLLQESCELEVIEEDGVSGVKYASIHNDVESLSACLTICKLVGNQTCVGVHYAHWNEVCKLIVKEERGHNHFYPVGENEILAFVKECRKNAPAEPQQPIEIPEEEEVWPEFPEYEDSDEESEDGITSEYLLQNREYCKIRDRTDEKTIKGYGLTSTMPETSSLDNCLVYCRMGWSDVPCAAVLYKASSRSCNTYGKNETGEITVPKKAVFKELLGCEKARVEHVPITGLKYFLPTLQEVCKVEVHNVPVVYGWKPMSGQPVKVDSEETCLEACRVRRRENCTAVIYSNTKECTPMEDTYSLAPVKLEHKAFLSIMQCKRGTIVDILT